MSLRLLFIILAVLQLGVWVLVALVASTPWLFYAAEGLAAVNVALLIWFYRRVLRPLDSLAAGLDILKAQDWNSKLRRVGQREVDKIVDVFNAMLEKLKLQRIRHEERSHFINLLIQSSPVGMVVFATPKVTNPAFDTIVADYPEIAGRIDALAAGGEATYQTPDGRRLRYSSHSFIDRGIRRRFVVVEDVTGAVEQAQRAAFGSIIRLLSHEVNNTVAGLSSTLSTMADCTADAEMAEMLRSCAGRSLSLSDFVSGYASLAKMPEAHLAMSDLNALVEANRHLLSGICSNLRVAIHFSPSPGTANCAIDADLMSRALINIVKNAAESAAATGEDGQVWVEVDNRRGRPQLTVTDNGPGITVEKIQKMSTPFFSDKPAGQGIGLFLVREVLRRHNARYTLSTHPDGLTRFVISL